MIGRVSAAVALAVAVLVSGCGGDDGGSTEPAASTGFDVDIEFEVVDGEAVGGSLDIDVGIGDHVRIRLRGNSDDSVHVHAYDLFIEPIDGSGELVFDAFIPGTFEIELEGSGRLLARMKVS